MASDDSGASSTESLLDVLEEAEEEIHQSPDTFEDYFVGTDSHWLSEDELFELQTARDSGMKVPPPLTTWKERDATTKVSLTVAKARRVTWEQGKKEVLLHKKNVSGLPAASSNIEQVCRHLFGSTSKLAKLFFELLELTKEEYLLFLISYFKSCRYKMSVQNLHDSDDETKLLMEGNKYNGIWRKIATLRRHAHGESFWQEVESILNGVHRDLFVANESHETADVSIDEAASTFRYVVGLDDDKLHYAYTKDTRADGLKKVHHAKDNRHGFTAHTACHSATAAPLNVSFQRKNETFRSTTERMIDAMFGKHSGRTDRLDNLEPMDRGYWDRWASRQCTTVVPKQIMYNSSTETNNVLKNCANNPNRMWKPKS